MPPKNGSNAGDAGNQTEEIKLYSVRLTKPARISGETYEAGDLVEVDDTVGRQLERAGALELPEAYDGRKPTEDEKQA